MTAAEQVRAKFPEHATCAEGAAYKRQGPGPIKIKCGCGRTLRISQGADVYGTQGTGVNVKRGERYAHVRMVRPKGSTGRLRDKIGEALEKAREMGHDPAILALTAHKSTKA